jgi:hypothetical protein
VLVVVRREAEYLVVHRSPESGAYRHLVGWASAAVNGSIRVFAVVITASRMTRAQAARHILTVRIIERWC